MAVAYYNLDSGNFVGMSLSDKDIPGVGKTSVIPPPFQQHEYPVYSEDTETWLLLPVQNRTFLPLGFGDNLGNFNNSNFGA